jgi:Tol biopolymer transport system component
MVTIQRRLALRTASWLVLLALADGAAAQVGCSFRQLTTTTGAFDYFGLSLDNAGARVGFSSSGDFTGQNADGNVELFYADVDAGTVTQASNTVTGTNRDALISADGARIFLGSSSDLTGGNADGNLDVFVYDVAGGAFTQLTSTAGVHTLTSIVRDADASQLAFSGMFDPLGSNPDGNSELFLLQTGSSTLSQVTNTSGLGTNAAPSLDGAGTHLALTSNFNLTGGNADGSSEVFRIDLGTSVATQITSSAVDSFYSAATPDGTRILFASQANFDGSNPDGSQELFLADLGPATITALTASATGSTLPPRIAANGAWVAFPSSADLTGQNADGSFEIFLLELATGIFTQLSNDPVGTVFVAINGNGSRVVFASAADLTGGNADGSRELFLYDCLGGPPAVEVPGLGGPQIVLLALALAATALVLLRRPS